MEVNVQKGLLTTNYLVQPLHIEMAIKGAFIVYTAALQHVACCKDSAKSCTHSFLPLSDCFYQDKMIMHVSKWVKVYSGRSLKH